MQPSLGIAIVCADNEVSQEKGGTNGRYQYSHEQIDVDEEYNEYALYKHHRADDDDDYDDDGRQKATAMGIHQELTTCCDVEQGAGNGTMIVAAAAAAARSSFQHSTTVAASPVVIGAPKTVSFAVTAADVSRNSCIHTTNNNNNNHLLVVPGLARMDDTTTAAAAAFERTKKTPGRQAHLEPSLPAQVIAVVEHRSRGVGIGGTIAMGAATTGGGMGRRVGGGGDETTTISTLSFGGHNKAPVQVTTPGETPSFYVGVGLALIVTAALAFLIAFQLAMRRR